MNERRCKVCGYSESTCECEYPEMIEQTPVDKIKKNHPGHSDESCKIGSMLGVDFPYVPGDPFW